MELAVASIGTNTYGYAYDTIGNRLWSAANAATNSYTANSLNQYTTVGRAAPSASQTCTETIATFDPATGAETETVTSSIAPTIIRRRLHGILLSTETDGETTENAYDAFGRAAATSRTIGEAALSPFQTFTCSPCGDLIAKHTYTNGTDIITETYAYDLLGNRIATTDALGSTVTL